MTSFESAGAPRRPLHAMLGVAEDADIGDLRLAYEQAMRRATNSGDHQRAVELSRAFDALPLAVRHRIYPRSSTGHPTFGAPGGAPRRSRISGIRRVRRRARRLLGWLIFVAVIAAVAWYAWAHRTSPDALPAPHGVQMLPHRPAR